MKRGGVLKRLARHPWEYVGWILLLGCAVNTVRRGYPPPGAGDLERQAQGQATLPVRALQNELGVVLRSSWSNGVQ